MTEKFVERTRDRLRAEILDAATAAVLARGWRGLRMQRVADAVGVSRQTLYNEYANKQGLAIALATTISSWYFLENARIIEQSPDVRTAIHNAVLWTMQTSANDTLLKTMLGADGRETFLPLYTSEGAPMIDSAVSTVGSAFRRRFPDLNPDRLSLVMETITRHVTSHLVLPTRPAERVAQDAASLFGHYLLAPATPPGLSRPG